MAASLRALWVKAGMICAYAEASAQAFFLIFLFTFFIKNRSAFG
jgi:hypothetical protein